MQQIRQKQLVYLEWDVQQLPQNFQHTVNKVLTTVLHQHIEHLMLDFQELADYLPVSMQHYAITQWLPKLPIAGLKSLTVIVPNKIIGQVAIRNIFIHNNQHHLPITYLNTRSSVK